MFEYKEEHYYFLKLLETLCEELRTAHITGNTALIRKCNQSIIRHLRKKDEPAF